MCINIIVTFSTDLSVVSFIQFTTPLTQLCVNVYKIHSCAFIHFSMATFHFAEVSSK